MADCYGPCPACLGFSIERSDGSRGCVSACIDTPLGVEASADGRARRAAELLARKADAPDEVWRAHANAGDILHDLAAWRDAKMARPADRRAKAVA